MKGTADVNGLGMAGGSFEDDRKFISPCAGDGIRLADASTEEAGDALQEQVADVVPQGVVHVFELVEVKHQEGRLRSGAAGALNRAGQAILKKPAVGETGKDIMQGEVFVVLDLLFKQKEDHSDSNDVLGKIPYLAFDVLGLEIDLMDRAGDEHERPQKEAADGDECASRCAAVGVPEMGATTKIDGAKETIEPEIRTVWHLVLNDEEIDGDAGVEGNKGPAERMVESARGDQGYSERRYAK